MNYPNNYSNQTMPNMSPNYNQYSQNNFPPNLPPNKNNIP